MNESVRKGNLSLVEEIEESIMNYIQETPIEIGDKLPNEFDLCELFGVGRSSVREAIKSLVSKGILEVRRGSGTYVISTMSLEDDPLGILHAEDRLQLALDLCDFRLMVEPKIAGLACQKATEDDLQELEELCNQVEEQYLNDMDHTEKDIAFHSYLARCSHNQVLVNLIPMITNAVMTFVNVTHNMLKTETIESHRAVVEAIKRRDASGAEYAMIMHLNYNRQVIISLIEKKQK